MAKRHEPLKEFGRSTKKPKLDITINKGRPAHDHLNGFFDGPSTSALHSGRNYFKPSSPVKYSQNNFWDDDDDDVILLATQVAETEVAAAYKGSSHPIKESEITFSEFAPNLHASTSTQRLPNAVNPEPDISDLFNDDDDDAFAMLVCEDIAPTKQKQVPQREPLQSDSFKRPLPPSISVSISENSKPSTTAVTATPHLSKPLSTSSTIPELPSSQSAARRQLASERQIKFLMERVDALKKENTKLNKDMLDAKTKVESKEGESTLLRDELRHMKQQMQNLKMEKIFSTEAAKTECKTKIAELSKQVEAKQTELQLKSVECSVLKMRHADETKRFEMSMQNECFLPEPIEQTPLVPPAKTPRSLMCLRGFKLHDDPASAAAAGGCAPEKLMPAIFEHIQERGTSKKQRTLFQLELETLQVIVAQLQLQEPLASKRDEISTRTLASVCKVFSEFWTYVHSLEFLKNCRNHPYHEYELLNDCSDEQRQSIHQVQELHAEERVLSLRRYVACLSIICRLLPALSLSLLRYQHGEYRLLQIAIDALNKLGFSLEVCDHFGLLEAFALLLHNMLLSVVTAEIDGKSAELLVALMKSLIFCRPSPWVFRRITSCILQCRRLPETLSWFCVNSRAQSFLTDRVQSLYRFSMESCLLQVYAGLLEIAFPLYTPLRPKHFNLLSTICEQHVRFIYFCFEDPPKFILEQLPCYDDDDTDDEEEQLPMDVDSNEISFQNQSSLADACRISSCNTNGMAATTSKGVVSNQSEDAKPRCECYTKLCLSFVTLLFQLLRQWKLTEKKLETSRVEQISKISVKLLHIIFCDNYITRLFRDAEETTKHYLHLICKWWTDSAELLHFNEIHVKFLEKLKSSHIMPKQLCEEQSLGNVTIDLAEWHRKTTDDDVCDVDGAEYDGDSLASGLKLMEDALDKEKFFEGLKGYPFNFD